MDSKLLTLRKTGAIAALTFAATLLAHAQAGVTTANEGKTAEQVYKNIQVLKGIPANDLNPAMHVIKAAVGLDCEDCHEEKDRSADTKKLKLTARKMMQMMIDINKNSFDEEQEVTCYTCHRGSPNPLNVPLLPVMEPKEESKVSLPSADQIFANYVAALGGEQALRKLNSRVITGIEYIPTGAGGTVPTPATIERDLKAPNFVLNVYHTATYSISDGFDGKTAWSQDLRGRVAEGVKLDQERAIRDADFYFPLKLRQRYTKIEVTGIERVNDRDAYVIVGAPPGDIPERLYFDTQTGLLLRKWTAIPTSIGKSPYEENYDDYRDTGSGVKFPFVITMNPATPRVELAPTATIHVIKVQDNASIDDSKFTKPESRLAAAQ